MMIAICISRNSKKNHWCFENAYACERESVLEKNLTKHSRKENLRQSEVVRGTSAEKRK